MCIDFSPRSFARAFALLMLGFIAASCSSQVAGFSDNSFISNGPQAYAGEPTGSVPRGTATSIGQLEHPPVAEPQTLPQRLLVPATVRRPRSVDAIDVSGAAKARPRVLLLRGWFGVFSTGLDTLAEELRAKGINAEVAGHLSWSRAVSDILRERAGGKTDRLVLVGHSQGANNAIVVARSLKRHNVRVDLLVTLAPFLPPLVPNNVVRAINYYQFPGWGSPLTPDQGFDGRLSNIDVGDWTTFHVTIDKNSKIHEEISREIAAL
jgi:pimeloyl-ACP methyl ester carboxylesterase